jgi:hypothetical protein
MSPVLELLAAIPEIPTAVERVACPAVLELPATIPELPPPVERVSGKQHVGGDQDTAPSTPPSKATLEKTLEDTNNDPYYRCAAHRLCRSMGDQTSQFLMCINCNEPVHLFCAEYLIEQTPVAEHTSYISVQDFTKEGKARWKKTASSEKDNVAFCILCSAKMKAVKVSVEAKKLAKRQLASSGKAAPKKKIKSTKATTGIIRELRRLAAFQAQLFIFTKVEKTKADLRYALIEEQFHGCIRKRIKGACAQLIEGSGAFRLLYDVREGENDVELVLKPSCCGKETSSSFVAGVHFTEDDIRTFGRNKKVNGCALWAMGLTVLRSIKKALSIVPKLSPRIVMIDKNCAVVGYASGKNEHSFMQLVDNGMYAMTTSIGDDELIVDVSDGSHDDNERIGGVIDCDVVVVEEQTRSIELDSWDPFQRGGASAPEGFTYIGKLSFICFGPTSKFFASTLAMGGQSNRTVEEKKEGSRKAQRKVNTERANMDREVGIDRGMTLNTRMQCAFMAQNEDDAVQRHRDMRMVLLTKSIESTERLVELKMKMADRMGVEGSETHHLMAINLLMEKLEQLNADLASMVSEVRLTNPIVGNVLENAKKAMGLVSMTTANAENDEKGQKKMGMPKCDEDGDDEEEVDDDGDFVEGIINDD